MKKKLLVLALIVVCTTSVVAQQKNAIGLRLGWDLEVSYQRFFSEKNRIELDLGFPGFSFNGVQLTGVYHWVFQPSVFPKGLAWYVGPGLQVGYLGNHFVIAVAGQIGLEYTFEKVPIQLSLDYRPALGVAIGKTTGFYDGWFSGGLGIRYKF